MNDAERILHQAILGEAILTAGSAVLVSDDDGRYLAANDAALELLGYTREELSRLNARDVSARSPDEVAQAYSSLRRERALRGTARLRRKDGRVGTIEYVGLQAVVGGLPVIVSVTAPIHLFELER